MDRVRSPGAWLCRILPHRAENGERGDRRPEPAHWRSFQAYDGEDTVYTVVVLEYPEGKAPHPDERFYIKMISAYAKESSSRVRKRGAKTIAGKDGYEAITDESRAKLNHQVSIVPSGDRIFMLITAGPRGHVPSDDADRFRNSFRLIGEASESTGWIAPPTPDPSP